MSSKRPAIFIGNGETYYADACLPLVNAVEAGQVTLKALARRGYPGNPLKIRELPGISTIGSWNAVGKQNWGLDYHRNEGIEFTFMETGSTSFMVNDQCIELNPGDLTISRPWQPHKVGNPDTGPGILHWIIIDVGVWRPNQDWKWPEWIILTPSDLKELTKRLRHNEQPVWHQAGVEIASCFQKINQAISHDSGNPDMSMLMVYINELFLYILKILRQPNLFSNPSLSESLRTVQLFLENLKLQIENMHYAWTVKEMAAECGLSVTSFTHFCKLSTNMTPTQYLNHIRINTAVQLLKEAAHLRITDIALECGFCSSQYFAKVFKQAMGMSPKTFRKQFKDNSN